MRLVVFFAILRLTAFAQVDTSVITGTVQDESQSAVPRASVTVRNLGTDVAVQLETNERGIYVTPPLRPGRYEIIAEKEGLQQAVTQVAVQLSDRPVADLTLRVKGATQTVSVTETLSEVANDATTVGGLRDAQEVSELPVNQRNPVRIVDLTPGAIPALTQAQTLGFSSYRGSSQTSINGQPERYQGYVIDGIDNTENHAGVSLVVNPTIDSIAELKVTSVGSDAEFGRAAGIVNVILKSGTKDFHGSTYYFVRNSAMDAKNFFAPPGKAPRFSLNQYGGSLGGPLTPGKSSGDRKQLFFFVDYDAYTRSTAQNTLSTVPLPAYVRGDFSASPFKIYDPLTTRPDPAGGPTPIRDPFPGNIIPANRIDHVGQNVANLYPAPNLPGTVNNYIYNPVQHYNFYYGDIKTDYNISDKEWLTARYSQGTLVGFEPSALPLPAVGAGPSFPGNGEWPHLQGDISYTRVFSSTAYNEFRIGASRLKWRVLNLTAGQNIADQLGIPGVNISGDPNTSGNVSVLSVTGYQPLGDNGATPSIMASDNNEMSDNFSLVRGRHTIKTGFDIQRRRYNLFQTNPRGVIAFSPTYTTNPASPAGTGDGLAELLLGVPRSMSNIIVSGTRGMRRWEYFGYMQDSWKVNRRLTVNMGLRYELYLHSPFTEVGDRQSNFIPSLGQVLSVHTAQLPSPSGTNTDFKNFAPRLGIAYSVNTKTVARLSYGIYYYPVRGQPIPPYNPPFVGNIAYNNDPFDFIGGRRLSQGFERPTTFSPIGNNINAIQENLQTPNVQQWNLGIQRELTSSMLMTVGYVGTKTTHAGYGRDINAPVPGPGAQNPRRPWPQYAAITFYGTDSNANYNALQIVLEKRLSQGLGFQTSYDWSHCINDGNALPNYGDAGVQDPTNRRGDRANCEFDVRHRWTSTVTYRLPFGSGERFLQNADSITNRILGGWQVNTVLNLFTGFYFTPTEGVNTLNSTASQRPNVICNPNLPASQRTPNHWFNTACFVTPPLYTYGNASRNSILGPATHELDASLFKDIVSVKEGAFRAQLRAEAFNLTNTPQFNNPNAVIGTAAAGTISNAGSPGSFARTQRQLMLALRLLF